MASRRLAGAFHCLPLAVEEGVLCVNVESEAELEKLAAIAAGKSRIANISLRVNPDVDPRTHAKIATGKAENKFGIPISRAREVYAHAAKLKGVKVAGVDMHIGSQITALDPFGDAFALLRVTLHPAVQLGRVQLSRVRLAQERLGERGPERDCQPICLVLAQATAQRA